MLVRRTEMPEFTRSFKDVMDLERCKPTDVGRLDVGRLDAAVVRCTEVNCIKVESVGRETGNSIA